MVVQEHLSACTAWKNCSHHSYCWLCAQHMMLLISLVFIILTVLKAFVVLLSVSVLILIESQTPGESFHLHQGEHVKIKILKCMHCFQVVVRV